MASQKETPAEGTKPMKIPTHANADQWQYHQNGRDRASAIGCGAIVVVVAVAAAFAAAVLLWVNVDTYEAKATTQANPMDGSTAGANAVTMEDLAIMEHRDEWETGAWSVTVEDLEREYETGKAYPANGKNTPLDSDTTYGKGAGMVDLITYDRASNILIRHYGQLEPDGRVRWYAAETVLDENGDPVVMPRE